VRELEELQPSCSVQGVATPATTSAAKSPWLIGFGLVALVQLVSIAVHLPFASLITWLIAPPLAVWVWRAGGPRLLVLALVFCWIGDVLGNPRLIGIGRIGLYLSVAAFAVASVLLVVLFVRRGRPRRRVGVVALYLVLASVGLASIWSNLDPALRVVASVYLLVIVATATAAFVLDTRVGIGAGLLFGSHLLVALEVGGRLDGTATTFRLAVLALYMLGILLIVVGTVNREVPAGR
jgi:hypothetical protein